jgi:phosphatidylinositol glycan class K
VASSLVGEDSLSHHVDPAIGVYIIDRYTYYALEFLEKVNRDSKATMGQFLEVCPKRLCISTVGKRTDLFPRDPYTVPITDFFGSIRNVELTDRAFNFTSKADKKTVSSLKNSDSCRVDQADGDCAKKTEKELKVYRYAPMLPILNSFTNE